MWLIYVCVFAKISQSSDSLALIRTSKADMYAFLPGIMMRKTFNELLMPLHAFFVRSQEQLYSELCMFEAREVFLGIHGYWPKIKGIRDIFVNIQRDTGYFGDICHIYIRDMGYFSK